MKKLSILFLSIIMIFTAVPVYADQVWGDALDVTGSNHDQVIELTVNVGETWSTPLNVYIVKSGKAVTFPVSGVVSGSSISLSKTTWSVSDYEAPDQVQASKTENVSGSYTYDVVFEATTDLVELSKSFDKVSIKVTVNEILPPEPPLDTLAPVVTAPADLTVEATALLTPVDIGFATVDDETATISHNSPEVFPIGSTTIVWSAIDPSGNIGTDEQIITVVDTTAPVFTTLPETITAIYSGSLTTVDLGLVEATDIFPVEITNNSPEQGFPLGTTVVEWKATDANGNVSTTLQHINIHYDFIGFLQPINNDGSSIFKLGSTIPIKFQLKDANGNYVSTAIANITVSKITNNVLGSEVEGTSTSAATTGNLFRYDATDQQYIFNLNTKPLSKGTFTIIVRLDDGTQHTVDISLR